MPNIPAERLIRISTALFKAVGATDYEAKRTSELLVKANLRGHDSHGVIRLPRYVPAIKDGSGAVIGAEIKVVKETPTTAVINGNGGLGQVVATKAMEIAIEKAKKNGVSVVTIYNSSHIGRMADYAEMAAAEDMIGFVCANTGSLVAPYGGGKRILGTNPLAYAIPADKLGPISLDMATSVAPVGKVMVKIARGEKTPADWLLDDQGQPTTDPSVMDFSRVREGRAGALMPMGGSVAYKGYGLCLIVDLLGGLLSGSGTGTEKSDAKGLYPNGVFMYVIDIAKFQPVKQFKANVDKVIRNVTAVPTPPGYKFEATEFHEVLVPGDPERLREAKRNKEGIFVSDTTWKQIVQTGKDVGVDVEKIK